MTGPMASLQSVGESHFADVPGDFRGLSIFNCERFFELHRRQAYFDCTQHDHKAFDWDGRVVQRGNAMQAQQPLISAERVAYWVPMSRRRPSAPYRLPRVIVNAFTNMVFGERRFPQVVCEGDPDTQKFAAALVKASKLPVHMIQARNLGGSMGSVGMSWCFRRGKPQVKVHNSKYLMVHKWKDRDQLIPELVTECFVYPRDEWDQAKQKFVRNYYWWRRDWTPNCDVVFKPVPYQQNKDPIDAGWEPDMELSAQHNDGITHFEWFQNLPDEDPDGSCDYEGLYDNFDSLDELLSVITRGAKLNLDPTLVLKVDRLFAERFGIKKGSDNALLVDKDGGDASYLELTGESIKAGVELFNSKRRSALEVAQCVIPDPDEVAASGTSSVAMKVLYAPMLGGCDVRREQYGTPLARMVENMIAVCRNGAEPIEQEDPDNPGQLQQVQRTYVLPQRVEKQPKLDGDGKPTREYDITQEPHVPGEGEDLDLNWPDYFPPTPDDKSKEVTTLSTAVGAAPIMSVQTATELVMNLYGRAPGDEVARVAQEKAEQDQKEKDMQQAALAAKGPPGAGGPPKPPGGGGGGAPKPPAPKKGGGDGDDGKDDMGGFG